MHDPDVVVFDIKLPILRTGLRWDDDPAWSIRRRRRTNWENFWEPVYPWYRPVGYRVTMAGRRLRWYGLMTVWHREPEGHDSGTICKGMGASDLTAANVRWALRHWRHLWLQVHPFERVRRWFERCAGCGERMHSNSRFGYMSSDKVYHDWCMTLLTVRSQMDDLTRTVLGDADDTTAWRANYRLKGLSTGSGE